MKKITAIVLCVVLALSALVVLTACSGNEYVVSFREYNSKIIFQGKTINGKAIEPKTPYKAGYDFKGWFKTLKAEEVDGATVYTFSDPMDFSKAVTSDLDLYAKYELSEDGVASSNPYYVVGNFTGDSWNGNGVADLSRMLKPDNGALSATFKVIGGQQFKVKYADSGWHDDLDVGFSAVKSITVANGVELPSYYESVEELIYSSGDGNIVIDTILGKLGKELKIKLTYVEAKKEISIEVLQVLDSEDGPAQPTAEGYRMAGKLGGDGSYWSDLSDKYKLVQGGEGEEHLYTLTNVELKAGDEFKVKGNVEDWDHGNFGGSSLKSVTLADGVELPEGVEISDLFTGNDNISVGVDCTITITYNFLTDTLSIIVTAFAA